MKMTNVLVSAVLSVNAGYVDTAAFLALDRLFAAHVTGNFVTFAAMVIDGTSSGVGQILAIPTFCLVVVLVRLLRHRLPRAEQRAMHRVFALKFVLFALAGGLAIYHGPFADGGSKWALATGMTLVAAMAIQNAAQRVYMANSPPTTLITGSLTQVMLDVADLLSGAGPERQADIIKRLPASVVAVAMFVAGCALAAGAFLLAGVWCFVVPPLLVAAAFTAGAFPLRA